MRTAFRLLSPALAAFLIALAAPPGAPAQTGGTPRTEEKIVKKTVTIENGDTTVTEVELDPNDPEVARMKKELADGPGGGKNVEKKVIKKRSGGDAGAMCCDHRGDAKAGRHERHEGKTRDGCDHEDCDHKECVQKHGDHDDCDHKDCDRDDCDHEGCCSGDDGHHDGARHKTIEKRIMKDGDKVDREMKEIRKRIRTDTSGAKSGGGGTPR